MLCLETQSRCINTMYKFILQLEREPLETVVKKSSFCESMVGCHRKRKDRAKKISPFHGSHQQGSYFPSYICKRWSFFGFIELHCHVLGKSFFDEVAGQMVLQTDLSCYHNVKQKLHSCLNRFWFNWQPVPGTSIVVENPSEDSCCS